MKAKWMLLLGCVAACGDMTSQAPDSSDSLLAEIAPGSCLGLSQEECEASGACTPLEGWTEPEACLVAADVPDSGPSQFVSCHSAYTLCGAAFTWASPPDNPAEAWLFPSTCIPDGWGEPEGPVCVPECSFTECDECCASADHACDSDGHCCLPDCVGKECGDDGCGGSCGECADAVIGGGSYDCVDGACIWKKSGGMPCEAPSDCWSGLCVETWTGSICVETCVEECPEGWTCEGYPRYGPDLLFVCVPVCPPDCEGKDCGDDGCGGKCGQCPDGEICVAGACECVPDCTDKECGENDGCGNPCGDCLLKCSSHGECGEDELCLIDDDGPWFTDLPEVRICGFCGRPTECRCVVPLWQGKFKCSTDADCTGKFFCYSACGEEPGEIPCPQCVHGWCAYETHLNDPSVCSGSCGG